MSATDLLDASASWLARAIRSRALSPVEVMQAHLQRIDETHAAINAVTARRFEAALARARELETEIVRARDPDSLPPLAGLPYTAKEYIMVEGMPISAGIWSRRGVRADESAEIIRRLDRAGAILVGMSNVPEAGLWMETYNDIHGRTVNPWDPSRTAGGSSGGEGAIVAVGGVPFGLGADVGGSIRIPAAFCGTVGHKPTGRMVPNTGFWPPAAGTELSAYLTCGPLCRRVEDVEPIMAVLRGPDGVDTTVRPWPQADASAPELSSIRVFALESNGRTRVSKSNRATVRDAAQILVAMGAQERELALPRMKKAFMIWSAMMTRAGGPKYTEVLGDGTAIKPGRELVRLSIGRSRHTLPALAVAALEKLTDGIEGRVDEMIAEGKALQAELELLLGDDGVLLHPPYSRPAPRHGRPMLTPFDFVCSGLFNVLEMPATVVPMGFDQDGLPLSVQVIAKRGNDRLTLAVAAALEETRGGWQRASPNWARSDFTGIDARGPDHPEPAAAPS